MHSIDLDSIAEKYAHIPLPCNSICRDCIVRAGLSKESPWNDRNAVDVLSTFIDKRAKYYAIQKYQSGIKTLRSGTAKTPLQNLVQAIEDSKRTARMTNPRAWGNVITVLTIMESIPHDAVSLAFVVFGNRYLIEHFFSRASWKAVKQTNTLINDFVDEYCVEALTEEVTHFLHEPTLNLAFREIEKDIIQSVPSKIKQSVFECIL